MNLTALLFVGGGGALGAMSRYGLTMMLSRYGGLPFGTLLSNLLGCLVMGAVLQWFAESDWVTGTALEHEPYRLLLAVGFCGSFTTLSAFVYELSGMLQRDEQLAAFGYLLLTLGGGFMFFYAGIHLVRMLSA